jgi:hypothetical protein
MLLEVDLRRDRVDLRRERVATQAADDTTRNWGANDASRTALSRHTELMHRGVARSTIARDLRKGYHRDASENNQSTHPIME